MSRKALRICLSLLLLLSLGIAPRAQAQKGRTFQVLVLHSLTKRPVPAITVHLGRSADRITDQDGACSLPLPADGSKEIRLTLLGAGYKTIRNRHFPTPKPGSTLTIYIEPEAEKHIESVTVSGQGKSINRIQHTSTLSTATLQSQSNKSLARLLEAIPGVSSIKSGATISKPVIQGMHSSRILLINNGVRLESQSWGADHAPEVDHTGAGLVEVIKGAEAVRYGAGALGGVVLVNPSPLPSSQELSYRGHTNVGYVSNGRGFDASGSIEAGLRGVGLRLHGMYRRAGDYSTAEYLLNNTGLEEWSGSVYTGYKTDRLRATLYGSLYSTESGIFIGSHIGDLFELQQVFDTGRPNEINITPFAYKIKAPRQKSRHTLVKGDVLWQIQDQQELHLWAAYQDNHRQEYENRKVEAWTQTPVMDLHLTTYTTDLLWRLQWSRSGWETQVGLSHLFQKNTNQPGTAATPFIPNFATLNLGAYLVQKANFDALALEAGLRYDHRITDAAGRDWRRLRYGDKNTYTNITGSLASHYRISDELSARASLGLAWRAPDVNELYSNGLHHGGSWSLGNRNLKSERGYKAVFAVKYQRDWLTIEPSLFYQHIDNYIYDAPNKTKGENGIHVHWSGVYPIFAFEQDNCRFVGGDVTLTAMPTDELTLTGKGEWIRGRNITRSTWLPFMPADRYTLGAQWQRSFGTHSRWSTKLSSEGIYVTKQTRFDPEKELVSSTPGAYFLLNLQGEVRYAFDQRHALKVLLSSENTLNALYKEYSDRFRYYAHSPGRSVTLRTILYF